MTRMNQEEITNKDLMYHIEDIKEKVTNITTKDLPEINARVKTTNGTVAEIKAWKERMTGAAWAFGLTFTIIIIPLTTWAFITISKLPDTVNDSVEQALKNQIKEVTQDE